MNVNDHEQLNQRVRESPDLSASIIGSAMDAIIALDDAQRIVLFNAAAEKIFACPANEAVGSSVERFIPQRFRAGHSMRVRRFAETGVTNRTLHGLGTLWGLRATGEEFPIEASISKVESGGKKFFTVVIRDITERHRAEKVVRESEERFRLVADTAPVMIWMSGTDKLCTYFNKPWLEFTGRSLESELGNGWAEGVHPEDFQKCLDTYTQSFDRREKFGMEYRLRDHDGEYRWILDIGVPRFNQDRVFVGYIGIGVDVTERKRAEGRLREYERAVQGVEERIAVVDREYRYVIANRAFLQYRGLEREQVVGRFVAEVVGKELFERVIKGKMDECFRGKIVKYELKNRYINLGERDVFVSQFPIEGPTGVTGIAIVLQDITERKRAEEELRESEARYEQLAEQSRTTNWEMDPQGLFTYVSHVSEASLGYRPDEVVGRMHVYELNPEEGRKAFKAAVFGVVERKQPFRDLVHAVETKDGRIVWVSTNGMPLLNGDGTLRGYSGSCTDITERKQAEDSLRASEERLRLAQQIARIGTFEWNVQTGVNTWTRELEAMYGLQPGTFAGTQAAFESLVHVDDRAGVINLVDRASKAGQSTEGEWRVVWADGSVHWIAGRWQVLMNESRHPVRMIGVNIDVTERKRVEEALRESETRFRLVADTAPVMIWMSGLDKKPTYFNQLWLDFTGFSETDLQNRLAEIVHPEDFQQCHDVYCQGFEQRQTFRKECRLRRHDGQYRWMLDIGVPRFHKDGSFAGYIGSCIDVTDRKLAEDALTNMSRKLVQAQEQERARIARELHDDINQRLAMLAVELERLQDNPSEVRSGLQELRKQTTEISNDVQALSHELHSSKLEYLGAIGGMKSWCKEFGERQGMQIDCKHDVQSVLPQEIGLCLFRVLQEALHNAAKHSGVKRIEVQLHEHSDEIHLTIRDLGKGFDVEAAKKGRGLGLTSMQERVRLENGTLSIESQPNRGTTIHARVPIVSGGDSMRTAG